MPLKLGAISQQFELMAQEMTSRGIGAGERLQQARNLLHSISAEALRDRLEQQRRQRVRLPWLVATPYGPLSAAINAPPPPTDFCVAGADASVMAPERHGAVDCYLLNIGYAILCYGKNPHAILDSESRLCFQDEDLYVYPERRDVPIEGTLLDAKMEVESLRILQRIVERGECAPPDATHLDGLAPAALRDGPLTLWTLQSQDKEVQDALLRGVLQSLDALRKAGVPVAGYISLTDARDVVNSLRVWLCEGRLNECDRCSGERRDLCFGLTRVRDRDLFAFLDVGQRSEVFASSSQILERYGEQRIDFFYLNVGGEIARVEVPQWVRRNPQWLGMVHAAIVDQCRRSPGFPPYPPVLLEAHEQAVIGTLERRVVEEMIDRILARQGQRWIRSAKEDSKRRRGV